MLSATSDSDDDRTYVVDTVDDVNILNHPLSSDRKCTRSSLGKVSVKKISNCYMDNNFVDNDVMDISRPDSRYIPNSDKPDSEFKPKTINKKSATKSATNTATRSTKSATKSVTRSEPIKFTKIAKPMYLNVDPYFDPWKVSRFHPYFD